MNGPLGFALALSLGLTVLLETVFFLLAGHRNKRDLLLVVLVNVITNPAVVLLYWLTTMYAAAGLRAWIKIPLEWFAVVVEGYYYKKYGESIRRPFVFSAAANLFSFLAGVAAQAAWKGL